MEPLSAHNPQKTSSLPPASATGSLQGRHVTQTKYDPYVQLFLDNFSKNFINAPNAPVAFEGKVLAEDDVKRVPSPLPTNEVKNFSKLTDAELSERIARIQSKLEQIKKGFPYEQDFANAMLHSFLESDTPEQFAQNTQALKNIPKEEVLQNFFTFFANHREMMNDLKKEYNDYQKNYQASLNIAIRLHEEFMKIYADEGPGYDAKNGVVVLSQAQLEFAKSLANKYFPQILKLNWTPKIELQNASLIQAIVVGDNIRNNAHNAVFLPKSEACFILKETQGKFFPGTAKELKSGISYPFSHLMNLKHEGIDKVIAKEDKFTTEYTKEMLRSALHIFTNDALRRPGMNIQIGDQRLPLGGPADNRQLLAQMLSRNFLEYIKENRRELPQLVQQLAQSPIIKALKEIFPEEFAKEESLAQSILPMSVFQNLIEAEIVKNHSEDMTPHQKTIEKELQLLIDTTKVNADTLNTLGIKPDDAIEEKRLIPDLQALIQLKYLQLIFLVNQSFFAPMITPLTIQLYDETTPFFPHPYNKEFEFGNSLDRFTASMTCKIRTPSSSENSPNAVNDNFNYQPVVAEITIQSTAPSLSAIEHSPDKNGKNNVLKDLRFSWKTPKDLVNTLIAKVLPNYKPPETVDAKNLLEKVLFPQLEQLATLRPGDDLVIDGLGVHVNHMTVNKVRPYTNVAISKLPNVVSGIIAHYSGYTANDYYNPKAAEQLEDFTEKLDKAIKLYVQQAIAAGKNYEEINEFIIEKVSTRVVRAHIALSDWDQVKKLITKGGKYYRVANEIGSFYLTPTNI